MKYEYKERAQFGVEYATEHIQEIEASNASLRSKVDRIEYQLVMMLEDLVDVLPRAFRVQVQTCLEARNHAREAWYDKIESFDTVEAQQKTSPSCLPASDSL